MHRGHDPQAGIHQKNRDTVGGFDGHEHARRVLNQRIAFA
jgi:hypothetical protein